MREYNGNIAIGSITPLSKLHIDGDLRLNSEIVFEQTGSSSSSAIRFYDYSFDIIKGSGTSEDFLMSFESEVIYVHKPLAINQLSLWGSNPNKIISLGDLEFWIQTTGPNFNVLTLQPHQVEVFGMLTSHEIVVNGMLTCSEAEVNGTIKCKEIEVTLDGWEDRVFNGDYNLKSLVEVEKFIEANKHLPDIPSEAEVLENGVNLGEMDALLLRKIEELTLYVIQLKHENESLSDEIEKLKNIK